MEDNKMTSMMSSSYADTKLDKTNELNETMSIKVSSMDAFESKVKNLGGNY